jgi:hypothetical protein
MRYVIIESNRLVSQDKLLLLMKTNIYKKRIGQQKYGLFSIRSPGLTHLLSIGKIAKKVGQCPTFLAILPF